MAEPERVIALTDALGRAGRLLAPAGLPPADESERDALGAIVWTLDRLHGHGVHALGQLSFIDEDLLAALLEEARRAHHRTTAIVGGVTVRRRRPSPPLPSAANCA